MDIMSPFWHCRTVIGGLPHPPPPRLTETPARMDRRDTITHPLYSVAFIDRIIVALTSGKGSRFMPTDFRGGRTQAISEANTKAGLSNLEGHLAGSTTV